MELPEAPEVYEKLIHNICREYIGPLDFGERESLAWAALFVAFLTYPPHRYREEEYIRKCIFEAFDLARRKANQRFHLETPFPFDRTGEAAGLALGADVFCRSEASPEQDVIFLDFLDTLSREERITALCFAHRCDRQDILEMLRWHPQRLERHMEEIRRKWRWYHLEGEAGDWALRHGNP